MSPRHSAPTEAARIADALDAHTRLDTERFDAIAQTLAAIHADVKSLLESRSFAHGAWTAIATVSGVVSVIIGFIFTWLNWVRHGR